MNTREIFAKRIRLLRMVHHLSLSEMALLVDVKSNKNINSWESTIGFPNEVVLVRISFLFGVSLDWLFGNTDDPYPEGALLHIERVLFPFKFSLGGRTIELLTPNKYIDEKKRFKFYSPAVRSEIIYYMNIIYFLSKNPEVDRFPENVVGCSETIRFLLDNPSEKNLQYNLHSFNDAW
jgi:transcriptional regulator with XRE-family HTH domain